ncbi:MAG: hypothetical protein PHG44_05985 [Lentisphaeria bacterium]|jgi:hypothetical protein|nr:hypothetical protein [Lentisphaeria bacterium]MDY0176610.1 hypothetical protein [Lentisphaeria bacterium]
MKDFLARVKEISFFSRHTFAHAAFAELGAALFFLSRLLLGLLFSLLAALVLKLVKNPALGALLATLGLSICRAYLLNWRDRSESFKLLEQFVPLMKMPQPKRLDSYFLDALRHWAFLLRPFFYFLILVNGAWFLLLPLSLLSGAFGYELYGRGTDIQRQRGWLFCVALSLLVLLFGGFCAVGSRCLAFGLLTCVLVWLLARQIKNSPWQPEDLGSALYLGELLCALALMLGMIF